MPHKANMVRVCTNYYLNRTIAGDAGVTLLILGFAASMVSLYILVSVFLLDSDATLYNLSLLTSDVWLVFNCLQYGSPVLLFLNYFSTT